MVKISGAFSSTGPLPASLGTDTSSPVPSCVVVPTLVSATFSCGGGGSSSTASSLITGGTNLIVSTTGGGGGGGGGGGSLLSTGGVRSTWVISNLTLFKASSELFLSKSSFTPNTAKEKIIIPPTI